jgi:hypothetical protein
MSTLANITSLNLSLQTGGAALAVKAAGRLVAPARTVYVYGTADDVAPNFTTVAGAITYANSLLPNEDNPVVVRLFANDNNEPYTLAGLSSWTTYANSYIYFVSDFVRLNETTTLPTTLPEGLTVWYNNAGVESLYVGNSSNTAQLVSGAVSSVAGKTGAVTLVKGDVGLGNVDNTSDLNKPVSTATQTAITSAAGLVYSASFRITVNEGVSTLELRHTKKNNIGVMVLPTTITSGEFVFRLPSSYGDVSTGFCSVTSVVKAIGTSTPYYISALFEASSFPNLSPQASFFIRNSSFTNTNPDSTIIFDVLINFWPS